MSKRESAEVIGSQSACGGWKITDITIIFNELCYCPLSSFNFRRSLTSDNFSFDTPRSCSLYNVLTVLFAMANLLNFIHSTKSAADNHSAARNMRLPAAVFQLSTPSPKSAKSARNGSSGKTSSITSVRRRAAFIDAVRLPSSPIAHASCST